MRTPGGGLHVPVPPDSLTPPILRDGDRFDFPIGAAPDQLHMPRNFLCQSRDQHLTKFDVTVDCRRRIVSLLEQWQKVPSRTAEKLHFDLHQPGFHQIRSTFPLRRRNPDFPPCTPAP